MNTHKQFVCKIFTSKLCLEYSQRKFNLNQCLAVLGYLDVHTSKSTSVEGNEWNEAKRVNPDHGTFSVDIILLSIVTYILLSLVMILKTYFANIQYKVTEKLFAYSWFTIKTLEYRMLLTEINT
ncbi:hypothetical protein Anas_05315 [Armadillidium nasatum]|uniref:Uncharacterized protein n=1 Tax=Armadillidium nasatum TaxID=96803 RepID=A0A5N5SSV5_9CRUS|nr:hypothetical protein Anas_05315 [Armadillidium nasatum]